MHSDKSDLKSFLLPITFNIIMSVVKCIERERISYRFRIFLFSNCFCFFLLSCRYSLEDSANNRFTIDPTTGTIITMTSLDREDQDHYNLVVIAKDSGFDPRMATTRVTIEVDDANDNRPQFEKPQYSQTILDPTEPGEKVQQKLLNLDILLG